jgi:hypothetical protein
MPERSHQHHEAPLEEERLAPSSERSFGLVLGAAFAALGLLPLLEGAPPSRWLLGLAAGFGAAALVAPRALAPLNRLWFRLGLLLGRIANPLVVAVLFLAVVLPTGLLRRIIRRDPLRLRWDAGQKSYWIERRPPGPPPDTMRRQF